MSDYETAMERIAPCGLHCGKCFAFAKGDIHEAAGKLQRQKERTEDARCDQQQSNGEQTDTERIIVFPAQVPAARLFCLSQCAVDVMHFVGIGFFQHDDPVIQKAGVNIIGTLASVGLLNNIWYQWHIIKTFLFICWQIIKFYSII